MSSWTRRGYGVARSLVMYHGQPWRKRSMRKLYADFLAPGSLAFDVGAHAGNRIGVFRALGARVVAFEPQPDFFTVLDKLYGQDDQVTLLPIGLAATPGTATLHISTATPTVSTFSKDWIDEVQKDPGFAEVQWDQQLEVELRTLHQVIAEQGLPDFCKIDVEGFEAEVVRGAGVALPALSFEYIPASIGSTLDVLDALDTNGRYAYRTSPGETHTFREPDWIDRRALVDFLESRAQGDPSGDVYARLID